MADDTIAFVLPENPPPRVLQLIDEFDTAAAPPQKVQKTNTKQGGSIGLLKVEHDAVVPPTDVKITGVCAVPGCKPDRLAQILDGHPEITWVHSLSAGIDSLAPVIKSHLVGNDAIFMSNGRGAFSDSLAEYVIAAAFHFNKHFKRCEANRKAKKWDKFVMPVLAGKTMGFVGWGHIAKTAARLAAPLGLRLVAMRKHPGAPAGADEPALAATYGVDRAAEFYAQCDFVVCTLPLTPESRNFVDAGAFGAMKASAVFISLGRGAAVDETALHHALTSGAIAGAACDVFATEPLPAESPLWECDNLLMTAHNADLTEDYWDLALETFRENLDAFRAGKPLATPVDKASGY